MTEARAGAARRGLRRPTEAAVRLDRPRQRTVDDLQGQPDAERWIETARRAYVALAQQIEQVHAAAQDDVDQIRQQQAIAVWQMSLASRTVVQISELLAISQADTWQLLSAGRSAAAHATDDRVFLRTNSPDPPQPPAPYPAPPDTPSAHQRIRSGVDGHHHGAGGVRERAASDGITQTSA
ncbi:MAG: hypothetical protein JO287_24090 [Pseudonocardiales bacterium]|nr:hypothetical protein [Pseudonocardiales bacterium]